MLFMSVDRILSSINLADHKTYIQVDMLAPNSSHRITRMIQSYQSLSKASRPRSQRPLRWWQHQSLRISFSIISFAAKDDALRVWIPVVNFPGRFQLRMLIGSSSACRRTSSSSCSSINRCLLTTAFNNGGSSTYGENSPSLCPTISSVMVTS